MNLEEFIALDLKARFGASREDTIGELHDRDALRLPVEDAWKTMDCYNIQKIFRERQVGPGRLLDNPCQECGGKDVYCGYIDLGLVDYYNNFWHLCLNCLDAQHKEEYVGTTQQKDSDFDCPFCKG